VNDPWPFRESATFNPLNGNQIETDFTGVKIGDINGTVLANSLLGGTPRGGAEDLIFEVEEQEFKAGEEIRIDVRSSNFDQINGYQFTLEIDESKVLFNGVESDGIKISEEGNFGTTMIERGMITTSWSEAEAKTVSKDEILYSLLFTAKADGKVSELLEISSRYTQAEAYNSVEAMNVKLNVTLPYGDLFDKDFALYQNEPNPVKDWTVIGFDLPEAMDARLTIYDVNGKTLRVIEGDYPKGYNEEKLNIQDIRATGVIYYQLDSDKYTATKKMIVVE